MSDPLDSIYKTSEILGQVFGPGIEAIVEWGESNRRQEQSELSSAARDLLAASTGRKNADKFEQEAKLERLQLVCQAMWELVRERMSLTDKDLEERILQVDLRDGRSDGKMKTDVAICGACGRKSGIRHHRKCFYCGHKLESVHIVEG